MVTSRFRSAHGALTFVLRLSQQKNAAAEDRLYRRLSALGPKRGAVASTINEYIKEGRTVDRIELESCIKELRRHFNFHHALEIMEWMEDQKFKFAQKDYAVRVDLIAKAKGISAAENYLGSLAPYAKVHCTYGALLYCYCEEKMTDKALALYAKMFKVKMMCKALPFNNLMAMYIGLEQPEKVSILATEMKELDIQPDTVTYNLLISSYSYLNNIEGVERIFEGMKLENGKLLNWTTYSHLASAYVKCGYREKAKLALKNLEELGSHDRKAYHFLISLYAGIGDHQNVNRVWKSLKSRLKTITNMSYLIMLQALSKLDNINGLKKCYEEWELVCKSHDFRLARTVIAAYLNHDMLEEVESVLRNAAGRSNGPFFNTWEMLVARLLKKNKIKQALRVMEIATSTVEWSPKASILDMFLNNIKVDKDVTSAEELYKFMKRINRVDGYLYKSLLETYVAAGQTMLDMRERVEEDAVEMSDELQDLLAIVCPEL